jgi:hypothetical protein
MLVPEQCRRANKLQREGLLLKEIAEVIGASFEDVALYLYGGIADWEPLGRAMPLDDNQENDDEHETGPDGGDGAGDGAFLRHAAAPGRAARRERPAPLLQQQNTAARQDVEPALAPPAPEPDRASQPPAEPARIEAPDAHPAPVAPPAPAAPPPPQKPVAAAKPIGPHTYYLTDEAGQWLHESTEALTKNKRFAWKGSTQNIAAIIRRSPKWKVLVPERVPG